MAISSFQNTSLPLSFGFRLADRLSAVFQANWLPVFMAIESIWPAVVLAAVFWNPSCFFRCTHSFTRMHSDENPVIMPRMGAVKWTAFAGAINLQENSPSDREESFCISAIVLSNWIFAKEAIRKNECHGW